MTEKNFSHFSQIQQMTRQATELQFLRLASLGARYASGTAEWWCWSPACTHPLCKHFVFDPVTIVPALLTLSTSKALLDFTHHSNTIRNNFKWLCCRPRTFLLKKKFASKLCEHFSGLVNRWAELGLTMRGAVLLAALSPQYCKQCQECSWAFNSWQTPSCLQTSSKLQHKQFSLCLPAKSHLKALSRCSNQCFQFSPVHKPNVARGWLVHPYMLLHMTYSMLISIAWGGLCQEGYSEHQKLKNTTAGQFWTTSTINPLLPNYFFTHRVLRKPQKQVSQDSLLIIGCIFALASHPLFFSTKKLGWFCLLSCPRALVQRKLPRWRPAFSSPDND